MRSLEVLEELNKILITANKQCNIAYENVGEQEKIRTDLEHDLINNYKNMSAKEKRKYADSMFECLIDRHTYKYEYREYEILKNLYSLPGLEKALNDTLYKLRKLNKEITEPIYYKRAKKNRGEVVIVKKEESKNE